MQYTYLIVLNSVLGAYLFQAIFILATKQDRRSLA